MNSIFSKNMIARRNELGWTQTQAADAIGITRSSLGAYEEGRSLPQVDKLILIGKKYKIKDLNAFLYGSVDHSKLDGHEDDIMTRYYGLSEKEKKAVDVLLGI